MVRFTADHKVYIKILYWGMGSSGKTTIIDTLYRMTKEQKTDIEPMGDLKKIGLNTGTTTYFDRGIFHSTKQGKVFYHIYTIAGRNRFSPIRKKVITGTDGVIFVVDSQKHLLKDNIESLKELKNITGDKLIKEIPLIIMLNKQDLPDVIGGDDFKQILKEEKLWYESDNELNMWNPIIYKTCALYDQEKDIYQSFSECAQRTGLYQIYGRGKVPKTMERINLTIPFELKGEWEEFAKNKLKTSLSQMIRDAVKEYQKNYKHLNEEPAKLELTSIEGRIEKIVLEKMEKILKNIGLKGNEEEK